MKHQYLTIAAIAVLSTTGSAFARHKAPPTTTPADGVAAVPANGPTKHMDKSFANSQVPDMEALRQQPPVPVKVGDTSVSLPAGTRVVLELQEFMVSNRVKEGQVVHYLVAEDVVGTGGVVVIRKGAPAVGKVLEARAQKMMSKHGQLEFNAESATAVDGTQVPLIFRYTKVPRNSTGVMGVLGWSPFSKGGKAKIKKGYKYDAFVGALTADKLPDADAATDKK
jgi:hypothetical protein